MTKENNFIKTIKDLEFLAKIKLEAKETLKKYDLPFKSNNLELENKIISSLRIMKEHDSLFMELAKK